MRALGIAVVLAIATSAAPPPARADEPAPPPVMDEATARAKKLFREGEKLFALGKFSQALAKYEKAYEAKPIPAFLFNIGQCHRNLGDYDQAIFSFRKYLKLSPDASNRDAVLEYIDELERERQKRSSNDVGLIQPDPDPHPRETRSRPIYKKWWFWGGLAVVGAAGATTAIYLSSSGGGGPPDTDLGNIDFNR